MEFDDFSTSRPLVHPVDVLGHHRHPGMAFFQRGNGGMSGMGGAGQDRRPAELMKLEHLFRIGVEGLLAGKLLPAILAPDAAAAPVGGDAALRRHPGAGEKDDTAIFPGINFFHVFTSR